MSDHSNRLTMGDEVRMIGAMTRFIDGLRVNTVQAGHAWNVHSQLSSSFNVEALSRLMAHSIGCSLFDLRDSELLWINAVIVARRDERTVTDVLAELLATS